MKPGLNTDSVAGFSHVAAGRSTNSRYGFDEKDYLEFWRYAEEETSMCANVETNMARKNQKTAELEKEMERKKIELEKMKAQFARWEELEAQEQASLDDNETEISVARLWEPSVKR